jgi:hypothetical protein
MLKLLVSVLLRQANNNSPGQPNVWLEALQLTKWTSLNAQNGQITGTSVNGKSVYLSTPPGCSIADLMAATEIALQICERGLSGPPGTTQARMN